MNKYERYRLHECIRSCQRVERNLASYYTDLDDCKRTLKQVRDVLQDVYDAEMSRYREYITPDVYERYYSTAQKIWEVASNVQVTGSYTDISLSTDRTIRGISSVLDYDKSFGKYSQWYSGMRLDEDLENRLGRTVWRNVFNGTKEVEVTIVGCKYHCSYSEFDSLKYGNILFLRKEKNNPSNPDAIVALKGSKPIGYVRNSDLYLISSLLPDEEIGSVACYIEEKDDSAIRVRIPDIFNQQIEYMESVFDSMPKNDINWDDCPTIDFGIGVEIYDDVLEEAREAAKIMRNSDRGTCQYMISPDAARNVVGVSRSFGPNAYYFGLELDLLKDYLTDTGMGVMAELKEIDWDSLRSQNGILFKFSCMLYKEYDHSIANKYH